MKILNLIYILLTFLIMLVGILDHSLWTPDEPRVAEVSREMAVSGDYLIPHLAGKPYLQKPPLYFAVTGFFYRIFGTECEGVGRFSSVIFSLGTLMIVFFGMRVLDPQRNAALAALVLATSFKFLQVSHKMLVDNALVFFITAALFSFLLAYKKKFSAGYSVFWAGLALSFLTKGLIGIALPAIIVILFMVWQHDFALMRKIRPFQGIFLIAGVMALWGWCLYAKGGADYFNTFYVYNQFGRFFGGNMYGGGHERPFYYYFFKVISEPAPWSLVLIAVLLFQRKLDENERFFYAWFLGGVLLLSIASTKRGLYLLPMYPAMACITAQWLERNSNRTLHGWPLRLLQVVMALLLLTAALLPVVYIVLGGSIWLLLPVFALTVGVFWFVLKRRPQPLALAIPLCWAFVVVLWIPFLFPQLDTVKTYKPFFRQMGDVVSGEPVIGYKLTKTIEAFAPFYGGFHAENIEDADLFREKIDNAAARYIIVLPKKLRGGLRDAVTRRAKKIMELAGKTRKKIELWKISPDFNASETRSHII